MINSITIFSENDSERCDFTEIHNHKIEVNNPWNNKHSFTLQIEFNQEIVSFRNHDYNWANIKQRRIANWYSPKILKLKNNQLVQANQNLGIWEIDHKKPNILFWHFNPKYAQPIVNYNSVNATHIVQADDNFSINTPLAFLFPKKCSIEISRSKVSFSAIACFTDHCDFDTLSNLKQQRLFFKKHDIKLTKGFFLNHFSKREETASYQFHSEELKLWMQDGHELAYHSLSQSIKPIEESFEDFMSFKPPFKNNTTWIDHGFQPYNLSSFKSHDKVKDNYGTVLKKKNIKQFWNYIDSGTAVDGVINQINPKQFTLKSYTNGIRHLDKKTKLSLIVKNIIFHYLSNSEGLYLYKQIARYLKTRNRKKSRKKHLKFIANAFRLFFLLAPIFVLWIFKKNRVYPLAKYTPVLFNHNLNNESFTVFQTLEMIDFKNALNSNNLDLLIKESGLFIAHTYFSAPMNYHRGKLFGSEDKIDDEVESRFEYLSSKIKNKAIWNPTLEELVLHFKKLETITFDCSETGDVSIVNNTNEIIAREVL